eukprot:13858870-Heterocapsa_arctica.AAC.1
MSLDLAAVSVASGPSFLSPAGPLMSARASAQKRAQAAAHVAWHQKGAPEPTKEGISLGMAADAI